MESVVFQNLGRMAYQAAWDYQEVLLQENLRLKAAARQRSAPEALVGGLGGLPAANPAGEGTIHHLLFVEHPPVLRLGRAAIPGIY